MSSDEVIQLELDRPGVRLVLDKPGPNHDPRAGLMARYILVADGSDEKYAVDVAMMMHIPAYREGPDALIPIG